MNFVLEGPIIPSVAFLGSQMGQLIPFSQPEKLVGSRNFLTMTKETFNMEHWIDTFSLGSLSVQAYQELIQLSIKNAAYAALLPMYALQPFSF